MARPGRRTPLRIVMVVCCVTMIVTGCGTGTQHQPVASGGNATHWPWDEHPPPSTPTPETVDSEQPAAPDQTDTGQSDTGQESSPTPSGTAADEGAAIGGGAAELEAEVVALTDQIRADQGCVGSLTVDDDLIEASRVHSADMADRDFFAHSSPDGDGPADRAKDAGYDAWGGENIAIGYATADEVVDAWMDSDGHRANIVNCDFVTIGVGAVPNDDGTLYWTQSFGWE